MKLTLSGLNLYRPSNKFGTGGYTLIEVLVAMAIFSAMLMLAAAALNQGLMQYHGLAEKGLNFWSYASNIWLDKNFNSTIDYYVYTKSDGWYPYFKGSQEGISYVTLAPFTGELPVVAWVKNIAEAKGRSLIYYELPVYTKSYEDIERSEAFGDYKKGASFKILDAVEDIQIDFYGFDVQERKYTWSNTFNGNRRKVIPSLIKISYLSAGKRNMLIFNINVNSRAKGGYETLYPR
jgi:general secretion pathway protein J